MKKIKTADLTGPALDWVVAKCEYPEQPINTALGVPYLMFGRFNPSTNWSQGGPIIEREKLSVVIQRADAWHASCPRYVNHGYGPAPLVAAMRCFVASKLGTDVNIPEELA